MDIQDLLDRLLQRGLDSGCYPGAVCACGDARGVLARAHVGKTALDGVPVTPATRYDMASLTKVLSPGMLTLRALEEGELTLPDTLGRFFRDAPPDKRDITLFQLLTHTAGFAPSVPLYRLIRDPAVALRTLWEHPLDAPPGGAPCYSCTGFIILGKLLETLYGQPLDALADARVFQPLGMTRTSYRPQGGNIAATERDTATGQAWCGVVHDENARFLGGVSGNAGVFSCLEDMVLFARMLASGGGGYLSPAMLKAAIRCHAEGETRRGLGFHLAGTPGNFMGDLMPGCSFGHTGFTGTSLAVEPSAGFFVVLLCNRVHPTRENSALFRFRRALHNALYAAYTRRDEGDEGDEGDVPFFR